MKKIATIAAIAALTTLAACGANEEAPVEAPATEAVEGSVDETGGPCGDGRVLSENEVCP